MSKVNFRWNRQIIPVNLDLIDSTYQLKFGFNRKLIDEVKATFSNSRWNPEEKYWSFEDNERNRFRLRYFQEGASVYAQWDKPELPNLPTQRLLKNNEVTVFEHQLKLAAGCLATRRKIWAAEMGTGKSLAAILVIEHCEAKKYGRIWWVAPKSALASVQLEVRKWNCKVPIEFMTYEKMVSVLNGWSFGQAPSMVIFDEMSRLKNYTTKRAQAANHIAQAVREEHPEHGILLGMSGSPAPKSPLDWFSLCEIIQPGYLREGNLKKFTERLAIVEMRESSVGRCYPQHVAWRNNVNICDVCGQVKDHANHTLGPDATTEQIFASVTAITGESHDFKPSKNEVAFFYERSKGLVDVVFKKDCLDLPQKQYRRIYCEQSPQLKKAFKLLKSGAKSTIQYLTLARELSDGFQYFEETEQSEKCHFCNGLGYIVKNFTIHDANETFKETCKWCMGERFLKTKKRRLEEFECPKDDVLINIMEEVEDSGRIVIYAGFTGSIDRIVRLVTEEKWHYIRVDGRGWQNSMNAEFKEIDCLDVFQERLDQFEKVAFIGHPGSAGMGLTLTAADTTVYFSNDFNAESRIQSEDRTHRPGSRGCNIIDLINLPTDEIVLENLIKKRELQGMTMGELEMALSNFEVVHD